MGSVKHDEASGVFEHGAAGKFPSENAADALTRGGSEGCSSAADDARDPRPTSRRGFLKKAAVTAGVIFVGIPVVNSLFFRGDADEPKVRQEGKATVISNSSSAYQNLEVAECEWVWPKNFSNPMVLFGIKNRSDQAVIRKVDVRVMVLGKRGHLLAEECVTIPSILPGEVCRMGATVATHVDHWIGGNSIDSTYQDEFDRIVVLVSGAGEEVTGESFRRDWPYSVAYPARGSRNYAKVEVTLQNTNAGKAELGDAILSAAYVCLVWRDADGSLLDVHDFYVEGLEEGVARTIDLTTFVREAADEIYVRPWRRDENSFGILRGVEVVQQRY